MIWDCTNGSNAVLVQLLLSIDRKDLAQTTYQNVKKFGNDSILVQAMEAWIGLKTVSPSDISTLQNIERRRLMNRALDLFTNPTTSTKNSINSPQGVLPPS
jgi:hypothetical protein